MRQTGRATAKSPDVIGDIWLEEGAGQVGGYLPATGRAFRVDDQGGTTCAINCDHNELFHPLVMDLIAPGRGEMVREPRPLLRWPPVPGAVEYRVTWFEHSYSARSISTGQRIPTQVPEYRFERDLVNERRYEWTVEAIDQSQRTIARSEHRQLHTPGADPEKFRFHPPDGQPGAWLGLQLDFDDAGVFVKAVGPDSPASAAGFEPGDRLLRIRDRTVTGIEVVQWIRTLKPGSRVDMVIMRNGKELSLQPVLGDRNAP